MTEAVRAANPMIDGYMEGAAVDVDLERRVVRVQLNSLLDDLNDKNGPTAPIIDVPYDKLVVAVGAKVADAKVPGADAHCLRLKTCEDARRLRANLGEAFEYASRLDVVGTHQQSEEQEKEKRRRVTLLIVGGGPTGVELAGELSDFAEDITRPRVGAYPKLKDFIRVILVHGGPQLLPQFEDHLRDEALRSLIRRGIEVRLNTKVVKVGDESVTLSINKVGEDGRTIARETVEEVLPVGLKVWCAGTAPVPFVDKLRTKLPEAARGIGGRIKVDKWLRPQTGNPETFGSILVLGDAASFQERNSETILPQTAQVAGQQGAYAARLLCRGYDLSTTPPILPDSVDHEKAIDVSAASDISPNDTARSQWLRFRDLKTAPPFGFLNLGLLAYLGGGKALTQVQLGDVRVFSYAGSVAFILWRSVYLVKQVASRNRILITFDWIKSALFGRDVTRL
jgi:NADH dehydrogenase FAD-containing subunit